MSAPQVQAPYLFQPGVEGFCDGCPCAAEIPATFSDPAEPYCEVWAGYQALGLTMPPASCLVLLDRARAGEAA